MLLSKLVCERTKEAPQDARIKSHILLARAGYIKQVAAGIYSLTPPAQRMSKKIQEIIREEMNAIDGQEVLFPVVMPREMWEESGRYTSIGQEMVRFKDRTGHDMLLGMTHEEAAVHMARHIVSSYNQLPCMIYQIQTKFRDEARSRGGLIRVREFTMKDAYSFHVSQEDLDRYYRRAYDAYYRIFRRIGLKNFTDFKSDTGMMGGSVAHEFMLVTPAGEDTLVFCDGCDYRANMEVAECKGEVLPRKEMPLELVNTGSAATIEEVCSLLKTEKSRSIKAVVYAVRGDSSKIVVAFVRGDREVNEAKLKKAVGLDVAPYDGGVTEEIACGNIGPIGLSERIIKVFDRSLKGATGMIAGANKPEYHYIGLDAERDLSGVEFKDIAKVAEGDVCPVCGGRLRIENGIEIGNIFQLGTKYTAAMNMTVHAEDGSSFNPIMGCYGIGVGRAIASVAEESNDENGLILPVTVAPWQVHLIVLRPDKEEIKAVGDKVCAELEAAGIEVLYDERDCAAGIKFADADLMGMPIRIVLSPRTLADGEAEVKLRRGGEAMRVKTDALVEKASELIALLKREIEETL
ncbi:MAG TPA: proline--tRNA ligase [Candidatus Caccalectryoclostridium excrementigallinarum]|uniref:Proline--tRNA ligase n=1 Tax=Candidatus Caccalectryoclostridium excrementigallinarum TaxID=2840710 RepID=A0A9D1SJV7_9FIRM|nr:proline--tRNA ligase [Candidatus Caccalectryoclostridium excrementigallinarum]